MLILCLSDMVRIFIIDKNAKIDIIHIYREKKIKYKGIPFSDNPMYAELNYNEN